MKQSFSTCLLVQNDNESRKLITREIPLSPGKGFILEDETPLLASGFPEIGTSPDFPLSPTLQLNMELSRLGGEQLKAVADAELARARNLRFKSYTVESDTTVCIIGDDPSRLARFVDTYGGLLFIEPLLQQGYHPDFSSFTELKIEPTENGCRIEAEIRTPIDTSLCNYCGLCGPACPEGCLSKGLFLDYTKCTFCRQCEESCPSGAIDIHGGQARVLNVPAVILLGKVQIDNPGLQLPLYHEEELATYFSSLAPHRVDEFITCDKSLCQFDPEKDLGCTLCLESCCFGALSTTKAGIIIDPIQCEACGNCTVVCPTGALQDQRFTDQAFLSYLERLDFLDNRTVILATGNLLHELWWKQRNTTFKNSFFLQFEPISALSLLHFFAFLKKGVQQILILEDPDLPFQGAFEKQRQFANSVLEQLFGAQEPIRCSSLEDLELQYSPSASPLMGPAGKTEFPGTRRAVITRILHSFIQKSGTTLVIASSPPLPLARLLCDPELCTHCMACLNSCRTGALSADSSQFTLSRNPSLCISCALCSDLCPEKALTLVPCQTIKEDFFQREHLASADPIHCRACGKVFGTKKSFERVMAILQARETVDTSHFEYCDTCRVINIFEGQSP